MIELGVKFEDGREAVRRFPLPLDVGRSADCGLTIRAWRVARRHAGFEIRDAGVWLEDYGSLGGTEINGRRVALYGPLRCGDEIVIGPCLMRVRDLPSEAGSAPPGLALQPPARLSVSGPLQGFADARLLTAPPAPVATVQTGISPELPLGRA